MNLYARDIDMRIRLLQARIRGFVLRRRSSLVELHQTIAASQLEESPADSMGIEEKVVYPENSSAGAASENTL